MWMRHIIPLMSRLGGGLRVMDHELHRALEEKLDQREQETFYRFLQNVEQEMMRAKRKVPMFPGGPQVFL